MRMLRLSVAGTAILALLGGGAVVVAQEPSSPGDLLPGVDLVTEEVEPGVFRVASDGIRDLSRPIELGSGMFYEGSSPGELYRWNADFTGGIAANQDGVWQGRREGVVRLGEEDLVWAAGPGDRRIDRFSVAPDGTLQSASEGKVLDGGSWVAVERPKLRGFKLQHPNILVEPDGSRWARGTNGKLGTERRGRLAHRDADGWSLVKYPPAQPDHPSDRRPPPRQRRPPTINGWGVTDDGILYVTPGNDRDVQRFDGTRWETLERPGVRISDLHVGPDGTIWVTSTDRDDLGLEAVQALRADEDGWSAHDLGRRFLRRDPIAIGADGAYWYTPGGDLMTSGGCDGIARLDGTATTHFLSGLCVSDIAVGPGGGIWLEASSWDGNYFVPDAVGPVEIYVITPEAMPAE